MGRKLTNEEIKERIYGLVRDEYTKLDNVYINAHTNFPIRHETCGHQFEINWNNFQTGRRCPKCAMLARKDKLALTNEDIVQRMYELVGDEYTKLDDSYSNARTKFSIRHNLCGCEYGVSWDAFQCGSRCPKCAGTMKLTNEDVVQRIFELVGDEYTKLDNVYVNNSIKFKMRHNLCGHEYEVNWSKFQDGRRCPFCNQSKGEKFIEDYLTNKGISFTAQIRFSDCKYKNTLPFDFAILDDNKKIIALIEYDGRQHFEPVEAWGGEENLKEVQLRDKIKDSFCKKNNIPLLRIRFDEQNMLKVIEEFLTQEAKRKV